MDRKRKLLIAGAAAVAAAGGAGFWYVKKNAVPLAVEAIGKAVDKGPQQAVVAPSAASGSGADMEKAYTSHHKALMAGDWEEFKKWTRAENLKTLEAAGGAKVLPMARAMSPVNITVKEAVVEGETGTVVVEGADPAGGTTTGKISMFKEGGVWKVGKVSWHTKMNASAAAAGVPAPAPAPVLAPPAPAVEAPPKPEIPPECAHLAGLFCNDVRDDAAKALACLRKNAEALTDACREKLDAG